MDAKDLRIESTLNECNNEIKYGSTGTSIQCTKNKSYQDNGSNPSSKVDSPVARPCAVIGPDRVVPPSPTDVYHKKASVEPWPFFSNGYRRPPEYPNKIADYQNQSRNISPRQTYQENMQRIMVPPTYNTVKGIEDYNNISERNMTLPPKHSIKLNVSNEAKYCEVPYTINNTVHDHKSIRNPETCVTNVNSPYQQSINPSWNPGCVSARPPRVYGAQDLYQYAEYPNCVGSRPLPMNRTHRAMQEDPAYVYSDPYYHDPNLRFKPYPSIKERYPPPRYDYISNYPNPLYPSSSIPPHKYDLHKHLYPPYSPIKSLESRITEPIMEGYHRPVQPGNYNIPFHNQIIHPPYSSVITNCTQNKMPSYVTDDTLKIPATTKTGHETNTNVYVEYKNNRLKPYTTPDNFYSNEMRLHSVKNQIVMPNYPSLNIHSIPPHPYYKKDCMPINNYEYVNQLKNLDPSLNMINPISRHLPRFSPAGGITISPTSSNASNDTIQTPSTLHEDCGYISQSSGVSGKSLDSGFYRSNEYYRRYYDPRYRPIVRTSSMLPKQDSQSSHLHPKDKKQIDVRQFLQMWNEGDDENVENNINKEPSAHLITNKHHLSKPQDPENKKEELYVLGFVNVPSEDISKYEHIQTVSKLPENIKGYNSIELLDQFEELSNMNYFKQRTLKDNQMALKSNITRQAPISLSRPLSPLDVEAKISQSVIHKDVGCNFEIKPCSPKMLNVEHATPIQNILNERVIEKITNPLSTIATPNTPILKLNENIDSCNVMKNQSHSLLREHMKTPSCKMVSSQYSNSMEPIKTNYSLQDLESSSGVCLASLPRLDNDIELNFPEVNQQFINATKNESNITPSVNKDLPQLDIIDRHQELERKNTESIIQNLNQEQEKQFIKLSKFRKNKNCGVELSEEKIQHKIIRTDSVIIKNPENAKNCEDSSEISCKKLEDENHNTPMNLTSYYSDTIENCSEGIENKGSFEEVKHPEENNHCEEIAIDFSFNKNNNDNCLELHKELGDVIPLKCAVTLTKANDEEPISPRNPTIISSESLIETEASLSKSIDDTIITTMPHQNEKYVEKTIDAITVDNIMKCAVTLTKANDEEPISPRNPTIISSETLIETEASLSKSIDDTIITTMPHENEKYVEKTIDAITVENINLPEERKCEDLINDMSPHMEFKKIERNSPPIKNYFLEHEDENLKLEPTKQNIQQILNSAVSDDLISEPQEDFLQFQDVNNKASSVNSSENKEKLYKSNISEISDTLNLKTGDKDDLQKKYVEDENTHCIEKTDTILQTKIVEISSSLNKQENLPELQNINSENNQNIIPSDILEKNEVPKSSEITDWSKDDIIKEELSTGDREKKISENNTNSTEHEQNFIDNSCSKISEDIQENNEVLSATDYHCEQKHLKLVQVKNNNLEINSNLPMNIKDTEKVSEKENHLLDNTFDTEKILDDNVKCSPLRSVNEGGRLENHYEEYDSCNDLNKSLTPSLDKYTVEKDIKHNIQDSDIFDNSDREKVNIKELQSSVENYKINILDDTSNLNKDNSQNHTSQVDKSLNSSNHKTTGIFFFKKRPIQSMCEIFFKKELYSPFFQKLLIFNEGKCEHKFNTISNILSFNKSNIGISDSINSFETINNLIECQNQSDSEEKKSRKSVDSENSRLVDYDSSDNSLSPCATADICSPLQSYTDSNKILQDTLGTQDIGIILKEQIPHKALETYCQYNVSNDTIEENLKLDKKLQSIESENENMCIRYDRDDINIESINSININIPSPLLNETKENNEGEEEENIKYNICQLTSPPRRFLKRSLSDSALENLNESSNNKLTDNIPYFWSFKRKKINDNLSKSNLVTENICNIINSNRRNSISSLYTDDNVSFCILIDDNCLLAEESSENQEDKMCYTEISESLLDNIPSVIETTDSFLQLMPSQDEKDINCEYSDSYVMECEQDKLIETSWVDDVACVETVVSDDVAEDIVITATSPSYNSDNDELETFCSIVNEHTDKVKNIYGGKMCPNDAEFVETLYNTPQMDVNKTLIRRESQGSEECDRYYDKESLERVLSESNSQQGSPYLLNINRTVFSSNSSNNKESDSSSPSPESLLECEDLNNQENVHTEDINKHLEEIEPRALETNVHSCESSIDNAYNPRNKGNDGLTSSSPEVSSTTSEEKSSSILLRITNFKGSIVSQINDYNSEIINTNICFTENKDTINQYHQSHSKKPLITKAAQKYIPPLKETITGFKVRLTLPKDSLMKLKQLKQSKDELKRTPVNPLASHIAKKPKPKFEDVLKSIDEIQFKMHKEKSKKIKKTIPKVVIKKKMNGSHYTSTKNKETYNPDLTGRKWQPWVFIEKNPFIDKMAIRKKTNAVFNHRKKTFVLAEKFHKYKSVHSSTFVITKPALSRPSSGQLKYTIRLKHSY